MANKKTLLQVAIIIGTALILTACGKKTQTNTNTAANTNTVVTEAPYTMSGNTKIFDLKLVNGMLNYKTMTFYAGDAIQINLTSDDQPVDFKFQNIDAKSTNGVFSTSISNTDPGGAYQLGCLDRECGAITVTVVSLKTTNTNATANTNQTANTNSQAGIAKVELQRLPKGIAFTPGMTLESTNSFEVGDQMSFNITGVFNQGDKFSYAFVNGAGQSVEQGDGSNLITGSNGSCCFAVPNTVDNYSLKIYINGQEATNVPVAVIQ